MFSGGYKKGFSSPDIIYYNPKRKSPTELSCYIIILYDNVKRLSSRLLLALAHIESWYKKYPQADITFKRWDLSDTLLNVMLYAHCSYM